MEQDKALAILKSGQNAFLTGSAGTGKTWVLNEYIKYLKDRKVHVAVTASTGIAATHMNGMTIHGWSGIGVRDQISSRVLADMKERKYLKKNLDGVKVLIIDEISMLHKRQLDMVNLVLKTFKENDDPFGGVQVVFSGDFFQLPPIGSNGEKKADKFSFMSQAWLEAKLAVCYLSKQFRQEDTELNEILNEIRTRTVTQQSIDLLSKASDTDLGPQPTRLYSHNSDVIRVNEAELKKVNKKRHSFEATTTGNVKLIEVLKKSVLTPSTLELREGAKVMFVKNSHEREYVNGTLGEVVRFEEGLPVVRTTKGREIKAGPEKWSMNDDGGKPLASFEQIPVRLAWAITVHKCQGMTLDAAEIDLSKTFEKGQGYVALSRLRSLNQLKLIGFNEVSLMVDGLAFKADKRFRELSGEEEDRFEDEELVSQAKSFVVLCDGLTSEEAIEKHRKKKEDKAAKKKPTTAVTADYIEMGLSLHEVAAERGLAYGTILSHLTKLGEGVNISRFRPAASVMAKVRKAHKAIVVAQDPDDFQQDGGVKTSALFKKMSGKTSYDDIKLALAFL